MNSSDNWLMHDHSEHEELLSRCREAVEVEDWDGAGSLFNELIDELKWHIRQEEEVVYPAYETEVGHTGGPTAALRLEHVRILDFIHDTQRVFSSHNSEAVLDCLERLEQLLIKHHEKEEDIFLPMASLILQDSREEVMQKMRTFDTSREEDETGDER